MVYLASDHGGYRKKELLGAWLRRRKIDFQDLGPDRRDGSDDYPIWAARLARVVQLDPGSRGILLCRSGVGMALVANKFKGIRAVHGHTAAIARQSRRDEDTNVLSLAADYQSNAQIRSIVRAWLGTDYRPTQRFQRRLRQIARIEHAR